MASTPVNLPFGGDFALAQIGQISLRAVNLPRAVRFYHDVLRLPLAFQTETMAFFMAGEVRLLLVEAAWKRHEQGGRPLPPVEARPQATSGSDPAKSGEPPSAVLYFSVPDIRAAYQALVERGVHFPQPPQRVAVLSTGELWMAFFRDSENNVLALMSEQPMA